MKGVYYILFVLFLLSFTGITNAQIKVSYSQEDTATGVIIHSDSRLAILLRKRKDVELGVIRSGSGYRVQIYSGNDRNRAMSVKIDFMRRFPGIRTYMTYVSPQFRVKVGDYRSRQDAEKMYKQVNVLYNPCMIVPDIIVINTLKND
ncbi:MAG TPA: SPOR domain-containing protein [Flavipsychrobacter sp.]|nr:SPOR domain-containing protein [Flavipsychrobacter sp.]